jgi:hypothetical protein
MTNGWTGQGGAGEFGGVVGRWGNVEEDASSDETVGAGEE